MLIHLELVYTEIMNRNHLNQQSFSIDSIHGGCTFKTPGAPAEGSLALHICQDPEAVKEARKWLANETLPLENWVLAWQKHTSRVVRVSKDDRGKGAFDAESSITETDGLYTTDPGVLIGVFTADCIGMLLCDPTVPVIGAVHSGWRGTASAILIRMLEALKKDGLLHPETLQVFFSPSLMKDSLEVGPEVVEAFKMMAADNDLDLEGTIFPGRGDRSYIDHQQVQIRMLEKYGVPRENIHISSIDTRTDERCFSYRREGRTCGEHFSWIWMDPQSFCQPADPDCQ